MDGDAPELSALLLRCPSAEPAVAAHRLRFDRAAAFGVPAHLTICFPFKPVALLTAADHQALANAFARVPGFVVRGARTGWFGEDYLHVPVEPADAVLRLIGLVGALFPEHPIYGGAIEEVVPHVSIGPGEGAELSVAEAQVSARLPFAQEVVEVELWAGPPLDGPVGAGWRRVRGYPLG
jgi:hypothetical protein